MVKTSKDEFSIMEFIDSQLKYVDSVSSEIDEQNASDKYVILSEIFDIIQKFITKNNAILYGGLALNLLLPLKMRFYDKSTLPDFDCFMRKADDKSIELVDSLVQNGFEYTEVKHAIHEGTYKVFSNFESVADITSLNPIEHNLMMHNCQEVKYNSGWIKVASTDYLKAMAYKELSLPVTAHFRWTKVSRSSY